MPPSAVCLRRAYGKVADQSAYCAAYGSKLSVIHGVIRASRLHSDGRISENVCTLKRSDGRKVRRALYF